MHKLQLNLDGIVARPYTANMNNHGEIHHNTDVSVETEEMLEFLTRNLNNFNFDHPDALLSLWTCEGFQFLLNLRLIGNVLTKLFGHAWRNKVYYNSGNWNTKNLPKNYLGFILGSNMSFTYGACRKVLRSSMVKQGVVSYERTLDKTFLSLHAASRLDRTHIFDHLFKNHYDTSTVKYASHNPKYYAKLRDDFDTNNHMNPVYDQIWKQTHPTIKRDDILLYCSEELREQVPSHFVNVISETNFYEDKCYWFTEKTLLPIMHGQPFITNTTVGYYKMLHEFGFKTFNDFWDESFNTEPHHVTRLNKFLSTLDYIAEQYNTQTKRQSALNGMQEILNHNRERMNELYIPLKTGQAMFNKIATGD